MSLHRVTFGPASLLERIGVACFKGTGVEEVSFPGCVRELSDGFFEWCSKLRRITFGPSSSLERVGRCTSTDAVLSSSRCLFLCERLVGERLANAH